MSVCFGKKFNVKMHAFFIFVCVVVGLFPGSRCMPDVKASRGFGCEVRTVCGHPKQFESIGICVMSLAQECEVRVPLGSETW